MSSDPLNKYGFKLSRLTRSAERRNSERLKKLEGAWAALYSQGRRLTEEEKRKGEKLFADLSDFLIVEAEGERKYIVERPTRLGNIIAGYELYPQTRYGIDGVNFWYHLLSLAPESVRKSFEEKVVFADSMVLTSAAGVLVSLISLCALLGRLVGAMSGLVLVKVSLSVGVDIVGFLGGLATWFLFYQLSLPAHRKVRSVFQALTDLTMPRLVRYLNVFDPKKAKDAAKKAEEVQDYLALLYKKKD